MKTADRVKEQLLEHYLPSFHLLETMEIDYPRATGTFTLGENQYTKDVRSVLSGANFVILFNQVCMTAVISSLIDKLVPEANDLNLNISDVYEFANNCVIAKYELLRFKKMVVRGEPLTYEFAVTKVANKLASKNILIFEASFSVCNNKQSGIATGCYYSKKAERIAESQQQIIMK